MLLPAGLSKNSELKVPPKNSMVAGCLMSPPQPQAQVTAYIVYPAANVPMADTCSSQGNVS